MTYADRPSPYTTRATASEPEIDFGFDANTLRMTGQSWMYDPQSFFAPHRRWLERFLTDLNEPVTFVFRLSRANSSSKHHIREIVRLLAEKASETQSTTVEWHAHPWDESIRNLGHDFCETYRNAPNFTFRTVEHA